MVSTDSANAHLEYLDVIQHWSPKSESFAGGDALITFLNEGWQLSNVVFSEEYWYAGVRMMLIYHFQLTRDDETLNVPVIGNPYIDRLVKSLSVQISPLHDRPRQQRVF